jgi:hypothetical protein
MSAAVATVAAMMTGRRAEPVEATAVAPDDPEKFDPVQPPVITPEGVYNYAYLGATDSDIADRFLVDEQWLRDRYPRELRSARGLRRFKLRRLQFDLACKLNGPILTWLGRNELGQSLAPTTPGMAEPVLPEADEPIDDGS